MSSPSTASDDNPIAASDPVPSPTPADTLHLPYSSATSPLPSAPTAEFAPPDETTTEPAQPFDPVPTSPSPTPSTPPSPPLSPTASPTLPPTASTSPSPTASVSPVITAPRGFRMRTVVFGLVLLVIAVAVLLWQVASVSIDPGLLLLAVMIGGGALLIVGARRA